MLSCRCRAYSQGVCYTEWVLHRQMHGGRNVLSSLFETSRSSPPAERSDRRGACWSSSAARYSGVPSYKALCTSTSSLYSIRFLTGSQCNCRSIVVMDCRSPRRICITIRAADRWTISTLMEYYALKRYMQPT